MPSGPLTRMLPRGHPEPARQAVPGRAFTVVMDSLLDSGFDVFQIPLIPPFLVVVHVRPRAGAPCRGPGKSAARARGKPGLEKLDAAARSSSTWVSGGGGSCRADRADPR